MQHVVVILYQYSQKTYQSHLIGFGFLTLEDRTDRLSQNGGRELQLYPA